MSVKTFLSLFLLTALSFIPAGVSAWQGGNSINGIVSNTEQKPLYRMRVELLNEVEMTVAQTYTDSIGHYSFRNLSQGTFIVRVHSDGAHVGQSVRVSLIAIRSNGGSHYEQVDFVLKSQAEKKGASIPGNTGSTFAQEVPDKARKIYERAVKQLENGKSVEQGVNLLKEAIAVFPVYFQALERLGVEYVKGQHYELARETLLKAADVNSNGAACQYALGVANFHMHMMKEAATTLQRSLLLAPESSNAAFAHFYLGLAYWKLGRRSDAEPHLHKSFSMGGNSIPADIHLYLAQYYSDNQRFNDAANELDLFLKLAPDARDAESIKSLAKKLRSKAQLSSNNN